MLACPGRPQYPTQQHTPGQHPPLWRAGALLLIPPLAPPHHCLQAIVRKDGAGVEPAVLQGAVEEAAGLVDDGDLAVTALSLKFAVTALRAQPSAAGAVCGKVRGAVGGWVGGGLGERDHGIWPAIKACLAGRVQGGPYLTQPNPTQRNSTQPQPQPYCLSPRRCCPRPWRWSRARCCRARRSSRYR